MKVVMARIPMGRTAVNRKVELYTVEEAKKILATKEWQIGEDIFSVEQTNKRIGWLASYPNGDGIYIEALK
jgi:hypothetical protein